MIYTRHADARAAIAAAEPHRMACEARDVIRRAGNDVKEIAARLKRIEEKRGRQAAEALRDEIKRQRVDK